MSLRNSINQKPVLATLIAVVVLAFALGFAYRQWTHRLPGQSSRSLAYYYDLVSGRLFVDDASKNAPIEAPSGSLDVEGAARPAGVLAYVAACGECPRNLDGKTPKEAEQAGATVLYLEDFGGNTAGTGDFRLAGMRVARVPDGPGKVPKFLDRQSPRARRLLIDVARDCADGQHPGACKPR